MAKDKIHFVCTECGADTHRWQGQCVACGAWNTLKEFKLSKAGKKSPAASVGYAGSEAQARKLSEVDAVDVHRFSSGLSEFDRVLGGGFVPGSVVLLGGSPGAGKSTILLQNISVIAESKPVLYVSGEESIEQIANRANRLDIKNTDSITVVSETCTDRVIDYIRQHKPQFVVIDSIQTMYLQGVDSAPGGVSQVRESAIAITRIAKQEQVTFVLVGHVTKDQSLAGPASLSHIVDCSVTISSTDDSRYRLMRTTKNRFGSVNELGVFAMTESGLKEVKNPSAIFLSRSTKPSPGSAVSVLWEGTRPLLVEIQSLVVDSQLGNPRRLGVGFDQNRVSMLLAVLTRHGGVVTSDQDVFVNVVGGIRVTETSADLAVLLAIVSSLKDTTIPHHVIVFGEVGLSGEIRPVSNGEARLKDAGKHGFKRAIVPKANLPRKPIAGIEVVGVESIADALDLL